jgi:hypothetical protein
VEVQLVRELAETQTEQICNFKIEQHVFKEKLKELEQ